jgi:hypothetical protein
MMVTVIRSFLIVVVTTLQTAPAPAQVNAERDVSAFAHAADVAVQDGDKAALERMVGEGFEFLHSTGRIEARASFIQRAVAKQLASQRLGPGETISTEVRVFGETAIRTTRVSVRLNPAGTTSPLVEIYTRDVYGRWDGAWHWISAQSTDVAPPPAGK